MSVHSACAGACFMWYGGCGVCPVDGCNGCNVVSELEVCCISVGLSLWWLWQLEWPLALVVDGKSLATMKSRCALAHWAALACVYPWWGLAHACMEQVCIWHRSWLWSSACFPAPHVWCSGMSRARGPEAPRHSVLSENKPYRTVSYRN